MTIHYNRTSEKSNRRRLRRNAPEVEELLWEFFKNRKFLNLKFKRQYSIDHFVIDFYCSEKKFGIELDGKIHLKKDVKDHDENRDGFLKDFGIKILRIKNEIVINNIEGTLNLIREHFNLT
jgi:very-short-patch-repair endonuclease